MLSNALHKTMKLLTRPLLPRNLINKTLPAEMLQKILQLLPPRDFKMAVLVCKWWRDVGEDPVLWSWAMVTVTENNLVGFIWHMWCFLFFTGLGLYPWYSWYQKDAVSPYPGNAGSVWPFALCHDQTPWPQEAGHARQHAHQPLRHRAGAAGQCAGQAGVCSHVQGNHLKIACSFC